MKTRELIIIGGGPAGYTAALYAARADLEPLVIEGFQWGGQLMITSDVENYPGYADGVMGPEMMSDFRRQAERFGAEFITDDVTKVDFSEQPHRVYVGDDEYTARAVIIATGATARFLGIPSEEKHKGRGVSACATCDAAFFRDKDVYVVGGGDSAFEEALFLTKFASHVHLVHRRDEFRASKIMVDRADRNEKLDYVLNAVVDEIVGDVKVEALRLRSTVTDETWEVPADGLFVAIGHDPSTALFVDQLDHDDQGYLVTVAGLDGDEHRRCLRSGRRPGSHLPTGDHRRRIGLHGRARRRALPRIARRSSGHGAHRRPVARKARLDHPLPARQAGQLALQAGEPHRGELAVHRCGVVVRHRLLERRVEAARRGHHGAE